MTDIEPPRTTADGAVPDGTTVFDGIPAVANLDPALLGALREAAADAARDGVKFVVNGGWRSPRYQERLRRDAVSKYGSEEEAARWVATPAKSAHVLGEAVDLGPFDATAWLSAHGAGYGLCQIYRNEPWHYELRPDAPAHGCPPMHADPSHDPRMRRTGITIYGCGPDEAALFRELAPRFGALPTITDAAVSEANIELASGNRCVSIGHKTRITRASLLALSRAGVRYVSTRSIGYNHIDVNYAESVGVSVENVAYSPDSVADYTLMLMLMAVRNAKSVIRRADVHDYRLPEVRGKELRDLTVGVVGTGRIGTAVIDRLRGFGCAILAYDTRPGIAADYVPLDELLRRSDIVTLHTPLTADTHHLLNRRRLERMKRGAFVVNTGRGPLLDTEALVQALESGDLGGAALDVVEGEEGIFYADRRNKPIESKMLLRLQELPNVLISPHTAYYTEHALSDTIENSIVNCLKFESGDAA